LLKKYPAVWSFAPFWCKKYPAVADILGKERANLGLKKIDPPKKRPLK
jgi:hypothetical protein